MIIAVSVIVAIVAIGGWYVFLSESAVARRREEKERELERPEHDFQRALEREQIKSELSRVKGWTGTGA